MQKLYYHLQITMNFFKMLRKYDAAATNESEALAAPAMAATGVIRGYLKAKLQWQQDGSVPVAHNPAEHEVGKAWPFNSLTV